MNWASTFAFGDPLVAAGRPWSCQRPPTCWPRRTPRLPRAWRCDAWPTAPSCAPTRLSAGPPTSGTGVSSCRSPAHPLPALRISWCPGPGRPPGWPTFRIRVRRAGQRRRGGRGLGGRESYSDCSGNPAAVAEASHAKSLTRLAPPTRAVSRRLPPAASRVGGVDRRRAGRAVYSRRVFEGRSNRREATRCGRGAGRAVG